MLNNDTIVYDNILNCFIKSAELEGKYNIFGGKIFYHHEPKLIWYAGGKINLKLGQIYHEGIRKIDDLKYSSQKETDYITGCCLFTTMKVINQLSG